MNRKEFLALMGSGAATVVFAGCLGGCSQKEDDPAPNNNPGASGKKDFTLNLTDAANASLQTNGGHVVSNGIIVGRTTTGDFVAVSSACTHMGATLTFEASDNRFHCPSHFSNFGLDGKVINGPAALPLKQYKTTLTGNSLRVFE